MPKLKLSNILYKYYHTVDTIYKRLNDILNSTIHCSELKSTILFYETRKNADFWFTQEIRLTPEGIREIKLILKCIEREYPDVVERYKQQKTSQSSEP